jgi:hypothetical protein
MSLPKQTKQFSTTSTAPGIFALSMRPLAFLIVPILPSLMISTESPTWNIGNSPSGALEKLVMAFQVRYGHLESLGVFVAKPYEGITFRVD